MKIFIKLIFLFVAVVLSVSFTVLNPGSVQVNLYSNTVDLSLSALVVITLFFGLVLGGLVSLVGQFGLKRTIRQLNRKLSDTETELTQLRRLAIRDQP